MVHSGLHGRGVVGDSGQARRGGMVGCGFFLVPSGVHGRDVVGDSGQESRGGTVGSGFLLVGGSISPWCGGGGMRSMSVKGGGGDLRAKHVTASRGGGGRVPTAVSLVDGGDRGVGMGLLLEDLCRRGALAR